MNLYQKLSITIVITSLLLCGSAFAAKPSPVDVVNTPDVSVVNTPDVNVVNTSAEPIPTAVQSLPERFLVHDGQSFALEPNPNIAFELSVPADVVLTDLVLSLRSVSLLTAVFVQDRSTQATLVWQSIGSAESTWAGSNEGQWSLHLASGLQSPGGLRIGVYCNNIGGNSCNGALMWSGYQP
jgi:hypothetical protein